MKQMIPLSDTLEQVHENLLRLTGLLERADVRPRPQVAPDWVDGQEVMNALHISRRTLQTLRDNGTLGYAVVGQKFYYRISEIEDLLSNNYVMYKLKARGKEDPADGGKGGAR
ncbi:helix-turn-helix domain-containing protein [Bacteroides rodentium]|uniref:helix-turn-helix domain-containing protein n=1 Tax=Bacteroides rodentium TaxID=691816 RepID=UPI00047187B4|nr:helix-turn-helix domain-containing protein [Bacteroides rodentium]